MLKNYKVGKNQFQFEEGDQPDNAVEIDKNGTSVAKEQEADSEPTDEAAPAEKSVEPENKANKAVKNK